MRFYEALEVMKRGEEVQHAGKAYRLLHRGIYDVTTNESDPARVQFTPEEWDALETPETVSPEVADAVLMETSEA